MSSMEPILTTRTGFLDGFAREHDARAHLGEHHAMNPFTTWIT